MAWGLQLMRPDAAGKIWVPSKVCLCKCHIAVLLPKRPKPYTQEKSAHSLQQDIAALGGAARSLAAEGGLKCLQVSVFVL